MTTRTPDYIDGFLIGPRLKAVERRGDELVGAVSRLEEADETLRRQLTGRVATEMDLREGQITSLWQAIEDLLDQVECLQTELDALKKPKEGGTARGNARRRSVNSVSRPPLDLSINFSRLGGCSWV